MKTLNETLESIFHDLGKEDIILKSKINTILKEILGENISEGIKIRSIKNGKLNLKSLNSLWAFEISINKQKIIEKINEKLEKSIISDIISR